MTPLLYSQMTEASILGKQQGWQDDLIGGICPVARVSDSPAFYLLCVHEQTTAFTAVLVLNGRKKLRPAEREHVIAQPKRRSGYRNRSNNSSYWSCCTRSHKNTGAPPPRPHGHY